MPYTESAVTLGDHPAEEDWERLAFGEMAPAERGMALFHVTGCPACARIHRALAALAEGARSFDPGALRMPWPPPWPST